LWNKSLAGQKEERKERAENKRRKKKGGKIGFTYGALSTLGKQP
jgi:hypothetical protein